MFQSTLVGMSIFFASNVDCQEINAVKKMNPCSLTGLNIVMGFTREEENWIQNQFMLMEEAYCSVTQGQEFIDDFVKVSQGQPIPPGSPVYSKQCYMERVMRIFNIHSEFSRYETFREPNFDNFSPLTVTFASNQCCLSYILTIYFQPSVKHSSRIYYVQWSPWPHACWISP